MIKRLDRSLIEAVASEAKKSPRRRKNYNLHALPERVQRFVNVLCEGSYIRPHRHLRPPGTDGFELMLALEGRLGVLLFDERGEVVGQEMIAPGGPVFAVELAAGVYHAIVSLTSRCVVFEVKEGPYDPQGDKDFLPNFPEEGTQEAARLVKRWRGLFGP